tara:strand:- start:1635 stop:2645 length:1011 start_codon:yes stop_codon:yes gene_type:complete
MSKIILTGAAGFIGFHTALRLLERGDTVLGIDNLNKYYDVNLKRDRLKILMDYNNYIFREGDIADAIFLTECFKDFLPEKVINLAAQAGVRYSIENPNSYIKSNIIGFSNILECARSFQIDHLVYASSSSVYGANKKIPFSIHDNVDHPLSLYAASKKSNELMAHTYSNLFKIPSTGLRFFTVYGPWGRPDMALFKFTKSIIEKKPIKVFNFGNHKRDFTYVDDIVEGVVKVVDNPATINKNWDPINPDSGSSFCPWRVYNIGCSEPVHLLDFIAILENNLGIVAEKVMLPLQDGDVPDTYADITDLQKDLKYEPKISVEQGIKKFVDWYKEYYEQ